MISYVARLEDKQPSEKFDDGRIRLIAAVKAVTVQLYDLDLNAFDVLIISMSTGKSNSSSPESIQAYDAYWRACSCRCHINKLCSKHHSWAELEDR